MEMRRFCHRNKMKKRQCLLSLTGQSLLEIAIFGSIIIMLLGVLVSYGLRYNYQQQAMQQTFRKALKSAAETSLDGKPISVSHITVKDKHIPNPSDTFGIGSVQPISASASVVRNYRMQETIEAEDELPVVAIDIEGGKCPGSRFSRKGSDPPCYYLTAGFRDEDNVPESSLGKYKVIYGQSNVWVTGDGECIGVWSWGHTGESYCTEYGKKIRIIDSCSGEILSYDAAVKQCQMIKDPVVCEEECNRGGGDPVNCSSTCAQSIQVQVPWYCGKLNELFGPSGLSNMGLQQGYGQHTITSASLKKVEDASGITTTDNINWNTRATRKIIYRPYNDNSAEAVEQEVTNDVGQNKSQEWTAAW